jgi:hypothetical protein
MFVGIHRDFGHNDNTFAEVYSQILKINNIPFRFLDVNDQGKFWEDLKDVTHFIFRWGQYDDEKNLSGSIMPVLYFSKDINCFPDYHTSWHYDNKMAQNYLLKANEFPMIETTVFWDKEKAKQYFENAKFPLVLKLSAGAGSSNVKLLKNKRQAIIITDRIFSKGFSNSGFQRILSPYNYLFFKKLITNFMYGEKDYWQINKNYLLTQKYLPNNTFDTRIVTIGNRAVGFIRYNRPSDFRASGSGKFNLDPNLVNQKCLMIAFEVSRKFKFQIMAYDFLFDEQNEPQICEISYTFSCGKPYTDCPGYWDENLDWHEGKNWLEYYQLIDFLGIPDLKRLEV